MLHPISSRLCCCAPGKAAGEDPRLETLRDRFDEREASDDDVKVGVHDCDDRDPKAVRKMASVSFLGFVNESEPDDDDGYQSSVSIISNTCLSKQRTLWTYRVLDAKMAMM